MLEKIQFFLFKKVSPVGLAIFRIAYCLVFLFEIITIFNYRQLYFDKIPYLDVHFPDNEMLLLLWISVIIAVLIGFFTRIATVVNYVFTIVFISSMTMYEYHIFYTYVGVNFLLMFLPISKVLSVDRIREKIKYIDKGLLYNEDKIAKINYLAPIFIGIGLFYFDSATVYKMQSPMWLKGLGLWLPSSVPPITISENQWFLNQEFLVKFLSYLTMVFEFMFVFLFWNKRYRVVMVLIGICLHLGIFIEFPIPYFALGYVAIYLAMVPISFWSTFWNKMFPKKHKVTLFYDKNKVTANKFITLIRCFDIFNAIKISSKDKFLEDTKLVANKNLILTDPEGVSHVTKDLYLKICKASPLCYPIFWCSGLKPFKNSFITSLNQDSETSRTMEFVNFKHNSSGRTNNIFLISFVLLAILLQVQVHHNLFWFTNSGSVNKFSKKYLGITSHDVFVDAHFYGYKNVYTLKYKGELLPILDDKGMADQYVSGGSFAYWVFRVNKPFVKENQYSLRKGMIDYSSFWMHRTNIDMLKKQEFEIVRKKIYLSFQWEKDLLNKNIKIPWENVGKLTWQNKAPKFLWSSSIKK